MLPVELAFVDIETTGSNLTNDRVLEVAIIRTNGHQVTDVFSSVINPKIQVSPYILNFTSIKKKEINKAPSFEELKDEMLGLLEGAVFVAHNVEFDYNFLKNEFLRNGIDLNLDRLCTVKLSKALYPDYRRHNLDEIIRRHSIECLSRHRALGDAKVIFEFYHKMLTEFPEEKLDKVIKRLLQLAIIPLTGIKQ